MLICRLASRYDFGSVFKDLLERLVKIFGYILTHITSQKDRTGPSPRDVENKGEGAGVNFTAILLNSMILSTLGGMSSTSLVLLLTQQHVNEIEALYHICTQTWILHRHPP